MHKGIHVATAALLGLLIACAPDGRQAVAQNSAQDPLDDPDYFIIDPGNFINSLNSLFGVATPGTIEAENHAQRKRRAIKAYIGAVNALAKGDSSGFARYRRQLQISAQDSNRLDHPDIVDFSRGLLATLPENYTPGFAYRREDGTIARDPSPFIQYFLRREGDRAFSGGGGDGAAAD